MRPRSKRSIASRSDARIPVLDLVSSRIQLQRRDFESAIALSHRVLEGVEPGSDESDYALLNLVTLYFQTTKWRAVTRLRAAIAGINIERPTPSDCGRHRTFD